MATETIETARPEAVERVHPPAHLVEPLVVEVVATFTTVALLAHDPHPSEHGEMLRDGRPADGHRRRQLADRLVAGGELGDERAPHGMGDGAEGVGDGRRA